MTEEQKNQVTSNDKKSFWSRIWDPNNQRGNWMPALAFVGTLGIVTIIVYAVVVSFVNPVTGKAFPLSLSAGITGLLLGGAATLAGVLLGFLFGIPRSIVQERQPGNASDTSADNRPITRGGYGTNTNLEQISDWLTKIIVGVGLTQLAQIQSGFGTVARFFGPSLGPGLIGQSIAVVIVLYFSIAGFVFGYLWTRIYSPTEFGRADIESQLLFIEQKKEEIEDRLMEMVEDILNQPHPPQSTLKKFTDELRKAPQGAKGSVFQRAKDTRSSNWRDPNTRPRVGRTIPIFRALTEVDATSHRYFAQLGYALKDQDNPQLDEAIEALTRAIQLREAAGKRGWPLYEFNRAVARIRKLKSTSPDTATKDAIIADLRVTKAILEPSWLEDPEVKRWLADNGLSAQTL